MFKFTLRFPLHEEKGIIQYSIVYQGSFYFLINILARNIWTVYSIFSQDDSSLTVFPISHISCLPV